MAAPACTARILGPADRRVFCGFITRAMDMPPSSAKRQPTGRTLTVGTPSAAWGCNDADFKEFATPFALLGTTVTLPISQ